MVTVIDKIRYSSDRMSVELFFTNSDYKGKACAIAIDYDTPISSLVKILEHVDSAFNASN